MVNPQWLELTMSRTNFNGPKDVRAIEVRLYFCPTLDSGRERRAVEMIQDQSLRKNVAGLGINLTTPRSAVRCAATCTIGPGN